MTKRSTYPEGFAESRRWWDCGSRDDMEWTWEGGSKELYMIFSLSNAQREIPPVIKGKRMIVR